MFEKLGKNSEFKKVYKFGKSKANRYLVMILVERESGPNRYGFLSVRRSEIALCVIGSPGYFVNPFEQMTAKLKKSYNVVIVARNTAKGRSFQEIESAVFALMSITWYNVVCGCTRRSSNFIW